MKKHHFDAFQNEKHFEKQLQPYSQACQIQSMQEGKLQNPYGGRWDSKMIYLACMIISTNFSITMLFPS